MNLFKETEGFNSDSRVWIFTSDRSINDSEIAQMQTRLEEFNRSWSSHNNKLKSAVFVAYNTFILLVADESQAPTSGCSIDTAMRFVQTLQIDYDLNLLDRNTIVYKDENGQNTLTTIHKIADLLANGTISSDTLFYDNLVDNLGDLNTNWLKPLDKSWLNKFAVQA